MHEWQAAVLSVATTRAHRRVGCRSMKVWGVDVLNERTAPWRRLTSWRCITQPHALSDGTRPVISNDGWHQVRTDIVTIHEKYTQDADETSRLFAL